MRTRPTMEVQDTTADGLVEKAVLRKHLAEVSTMKFSPSGEFLATGWTALTDTESCIAIIACILNCIKHKMSTKVHQFMSFKKVGCTGCTGR